MTTYASDYDPLLESGTLFPLDPDTPQDTRDHLRTLLHTDVQQFWGLVVSEYSQFFPVGMPYVMERFCRHANVW